MNSLLSKRFAIVTARLATSVLPPKLREWGSAMQSEVEAIETADKATIFAIGCFGFALRQRIIFFVQRSMNQLINNPDRMIALCAILATALGLVYMSMAGAPVSHLVMNVCALMLGFLTVGIGATGARIGSLRWGTVSILLGAMLMLTSLFGSSAEGATRWISMGGLSVQTSLLIVPLLAIVFARQRTILTTSAIVLTSLALAIQPDRGMAAALAAGMAALAFAKPERNVVIAASVSCGGFMATMLQTDTLPTMAYGDRIFFSSFAVHPLAGIAVWAGAALLFAPAIAGVLSRRLDREVFFVFGVMWSSIAVAAALGNSPTPIVGYGGSAIIGYVVCMLGLPKNPKPHLKAGKATMNAEVQSELPQTLRVVLA